jgi:hypothetical protein
VYGHHVLALHFSGRFFAGMLYCLSNFWPQMIHSLNIFHFSALNFRPFCDIANGYRYAMLGKRMFENLESDEWKSRVYLVFYGSVDSWREHVGNSIRPMEDAFETGLRTGDIEYAMVGKSNKNLMYALKDLPSHIFTS